LPPRPSEKDRQELFKSMSTLSEQAKSTMRTARGASLKVTGKDGTAELQRVTDKYTKEIDDLLKKAKAELAE
jgi:ribosome recycling factor